MNFILLLKTFLIFFGVEAASGLVYDQDNLYVVGDKSPYLYTYNFKTKKANKLILKTELEQEKIDKKNKPDFESIAQYKNHLYILGSGSGANRNDLYVVSKKNGKVQHQDLKKFYHFLSDNFNISLKEFNIEGFFIEKNKAYFLQRGNGENNINGIFMTDLKNLTKDDWTKDDFNFHRIDLPTIQNHPSGFSDGVYHQGKIYFTASAEGALSTFQDGQVLGSIIGEIDVKTMKLTKTESISSTHKIEGLSIYKNHKKSIDFILCYDNDDETQKSELLKYTWKK